jgi:Immunoglobulin I-set domain
LTCRESSLADILEGIPPTFSHKPRTRTVNEGESVELECRLVAVPEPELIWSFNGQELSESSNVIISMDSDMHSYMTLVKINNVKKIHEGTYEILARNREGTASNQVSIKVRLMVIK